MTTAITTWAARIRRLTFSELRLIAEAQFTLLHCQFLRWQRPVGQLLRLDARGTRPIPSRSEYRRAAEVGWAITRAARYGFFRPQCLVRSLALQRMLERRNLRGSDLRVGVRLEAGAFSAHAWVELNGHILGDSLQTVQRFTPTTDLRLVQL